METALYLILGIVGGIVFIALAWRFASRRYSLPCPVWLRWFVERDNPFTRLGHADTIIERLNLQPGMAVADIGCGPGRLAIPIAQQVGPAGHVVAMDIQLGMLRRAQEKAQAANATNISFLEAGVGESKLDRDRFDRALLVTVLGEIPDREAALREVFSALKSGGILSVTEVILDPHYQSRQTVARLAGAVGFREKTRFGNWVAFTMNFEKP
jgi:ubiquinone/menaquinone biosynthesis C-methylase UbiE